MNIRSHMPVKNMEIELYCPYCDFRIIKELSDVAEGQTMNCIDCNAKFNIYTVYKSFYEEIPFAKRVADINFQLVYGQYNIKGKDQDVNRIETFFNNNGFPEIFKKIVLDTIIYGNSFFGKVKDKEQIIRHEPALSEVYVKTELEPNRSFPTDRVGMIDRAGRKVVPDDLMMFESGGGSSIVFGMSIFGFWIDKMYPLKLSGQNLINASIMRKLGHSPNGDEEVKKVKEYFEREIMIGAGIPPALLKGQNVSDFHIQNLLLSARRRRDHLISNMERDLFPFILDREYEWRNYPEFHIEGHEYRYHEL